MSKLFEKMLTNRLLLFLEDLKTLLDHQFGFRKQHSTIKQIHRITHNISQILEKKKYCSAVFLGIQQAFDKVWHEGLLYKLKKILPHTYYSILKSYLTNRQFMVKYNIKIFRLQEYILSNKMGTTKQEVHRPGAFKQVNKPYKTGRHRSKGSISSEVKGKILCNLYYYSFLIFYCLKFYRNVLLKILGRVPKGSNLHKLEETRGRKCCSKKGILVDPILHLFLYALLHYKKI